jgi:hypothetical protein
MLQMRPPGGNGPPYAPYRDLVNCFPQIARRAVYCLENDYREPWFDEFLKTTGVTDDDLCAAAVAAAQYINKCRSPELPSPVEVLEASGFSTLPPPAQLAVLAKIGQVTMAMYYAVSRDALRSDEKPVGLDALLAKADEIQSELDSRRKTITSDSVSLFGDGDRNL